MGDNRQAAVSVLTHIATSRREATDQPYLLGLSCAQMIARHCRHYWKAVHKDALTVFCDKYLPNDAAFVLFHNGMRDRLRSEGLMR